MSVGVALSSSSASAASAWPECIHRRLLRRNRLERDQFVLAVAAYDGVNAANALLSARLRQVEAELTSARNAVPTPASSVSASTVSALDERVLSLQSELTSAYRAANESAQSIIKLSADKETAVARVATLTDELSATKSKLASLERTRAGDAEEKARRDAATASVVESLRVECGALKQNNLILEKKLGEANEQNAQLISSIMRQKEDAVKQMNEVNELIVGAKISATATLSAADKAKKEAADEAEREKKLTVDADVSAAALIDSLSWSNNFKVNVPSTKVRTVRAHRGQACCVRYSPTGTLCASSGSDGIVKVLDARSGAVKLNLRGTKETVIVTAFSPDDALLLAAGNDQSARVWAVKGQARCVQTLVGHSAKICAGALGSDGLVYTGSHDRSIRIWDLNGDGVCKHTIKCGSVNGMSVHLQNGQFASAHLDGAIRIWSSRDGQSLVELNDVHNQQATGVEWSLDGTQLVTTSRDNTVAIIDSRTWKVVRALSAPGTRDPYKSMINWNRAVFSPDNQYVAVGGVSGTIYVFDVAEDKLAAQVNAAQIDHITGLIDSSKPLPASVNGANSSSSSSAIPDVAVSAVDWNRNGRQLVVSDLSGNIHFWE